MAKNTFSLNLKTQKVIDFINLEKNKAGESKTSFINRVLESIADWPTVLTTCPEECSILDEMEATRELLNDALMQKIPHFATLTRRSRVQMILHLVEKGIEADPQLKSVDVQKVYRFRVPTEPSERKNSDLETSTKELSGMTA